MISHWPNGLKRVRGIRIRFEEKPQVQESAVVVFGGPTHAKKTVEPDLKVLPAKIGPRTLEHDG